MIDDSSASARRLRDVLEGVPLLAVSTGLDGRIRFCNRYMYELTGWTSEELFGRPWAETFNPGSTIVEQLAVGRVAAREEAPLRTKSGDIREISWSTTLDRDADGRVTGATGIGQDVTERNRAAVDLHRLAQQQAALRRVATCIASEVDPSSVFDIVAEEVACLLGGRSANVVRFERDAETGTMVGGWSGHRLASAGTRVTFDGPTAVAQVRASARPARVDDYSTVTGGYAAIIRDLGIDASVAAPISVGGELWGAIVVSTTRGAPLASDSETHIEEFAELVALGLASAEARAELAASRARIVAAGDAERRRLERNLHDGAQQRLVTLSVGLRMARSTLDATSEARSCSTPQANSCWKPLLSCESSPGGSIRPSSPTAAFALRSRLSPSAASYRSSWRSTCRIPFRGRSRRRPTTYRGSAHERREIRERPGRTCDRGLCGFAPARGGGQRRPWWCRPKPRKWPERSRGPGQRWAVTFRSSARPAGGRP